MVRKTAAAALTVLGLLALPAPAGAATPAATPPAPAASGELIVQFEAGVGAGERAAARDRAGAGFDRGLGLPGAQVVAVDGPLDAAAARLERQPAVRYAVPNLTVSARAQAPDDPLFPRLWGLANLGALSAWDVTRGAGQTIAVVDTGVDLVHPDLAANLWSNPGELPNGLDDDGNGRVDDLHGWDFADGDDDASDEDDHGTHVAGTAAAVAGNGVGVAGVAPQARLMAVRVLGAGGSGPMSDVISGVLYAAQEGASVINLSLGAAADPGDRAAFTALWNDTAEQAAARGALLVVAAGNDASDTDVWPDFPCSATAPTIVCVAALGTDGRFDASYSNRGARSVDLAAPGSAILSTTRPREVLLRERFDGPAFDPRWSPGGWSIQPAGISSLGNAAADSAGNYAIGSHNVLYGSTQVGAGTHDQCLLDYLVRHRLAPGDELRVDVRTADGWAEVETVTGGDGSTYWGTEHDLYEIPPGPLGVRFTVVDDGAAPTGDGVYVDDVEVSCRGTVHVAGATEDYAAMSGTSMASPHVAGVAALVRAAAPALTPAQVAAALNAGTVPLASLAGRTVTGGRIDALKALQAAGAVGTTPPLEQPPGDPPPAPLPATPVTPPAPVTPSSPATPTSPAPKPSSACAGKRGSARRTCLAVRRCASVRGAARRAACVRLAKARGRCWALPRRSRAQRLRSQRCLRLAARGSSRAPRAR